MTCTQKASTKFALVPIEATEEMVFAAQTTVSPYMPEDVFRDTYAATLTASPNGGEVNLPMLHCIANLVEHGRWSNASPDETARKIVKQLNLSVAGEG